MANIVHGCKSFTAKKANRILGTRGVFWADDYFDRYIRDNDHLTRVRKYIENNPVKAGLAESPEDWPWSSAQYRSKQDITKLLHPAAERQNR